MDASIQEFKITRDRFESWAKEVFRTDKTPSVRTLAATGLIPKSTVAKQLKSNEIDPKFILVIARNLDYSPKQELAKFSGYEILNTPLREPTLEEKLVLTSLPALLTEILIRLQWNPQIQKTDYPQEPQIWQNWFRLVAPEVTLADCQNALGLSAATISRNHNRGTWGIAPILAMAKSFSLDPNMALIAAGYLEPYEAGYSLTFREDALKAATDEQLRTQLVRIAPHLDDLIQNHNEHLYRKKNATELG